MEKSETIVLLSREHNLELIMDAICGSFGLQHMEGGNNLHLENAVQIVDIDVLMNEMGEDYKNFISQQKNAVCGHFAQVQNCNNEIKINMIHHLQQCGTLVFIQITPKKPEENVNDITSVTNIIIHALESVDGILITAEGTRILDRNGRLILADNGVSELDFYFPFTYTDIPAFLQNCSTRQLQRRNENMKALFDRHIYVCELPVNDDDENVTLRSHAETAKRMLGTMMVSLYSEALLNPAERMTVPEARSFINRVMEDFNISDIKEIMTAKELSYFQDDNSTEDTRIDFSWHYEHLYALEWVLGLVEWNDPIDICDVGLMVRNLHPYDSVEDICQKTTMRSKKEILDKADLIYRMDWAAVDARIHRMAEPAGLVSGVVQARHKTLNWMIRFGDAEWDNVDTPT